MKIVVIGGSGLIGSKLVSKLSEHGHDAVAADLKTGVNTITGEGLDEALEGAAVVVDVSNAPAWEDDAVMEFFTTATGNLLAAEAAAGVAHHVALSVVGTERLTESGYFRAKLAQEQLIAGFLRSRTRSSARPSSTSSSSASPMTRPTATPSAFRRRTSSRCLPTTSRAGSAAWRSARRSTGWWRSPVLSSSASTS